MLVRRLVVVCAVAGLPATALLAGDEEFGSLSCAAGKVVWITERTSAGITTVTFSAGTRNILKQACSTTKTRTGLRATQWQVTTTSPWTMRSPGPPVTSGVDAGQRGDRDHLGDRARAQRQLLSHPPRPRRATLGLGGGRSSRWTRVAPGVAVWHGVSLSDRHEADDAGLAG